MKKQWPSNSSDVSLKPSSTKISTKHWAMFRQLKCPHTCYKYPAVLVHRVWVCYSHPFWASLQLIKPSCSEAFISGAQIACHTGQKNSQHSNYRYHTDPYCLMLTLYIFPCVSLNSCFTTDTLMPYWTSCCISNGKVSWLSTDYSKVSNT